VNDLRETFVKVQEAFNRDFTLYGLKALIIGWAIFIIILTLILDNKWLLAGVAAYELLP
jgi:hypothetical protein